MAMSLVGVRDARTIKPAAPVKTVSPPAQVDAHYRPADMDIKLRTPEMSADWTQVWEDIGVLRPSTNAREQAQKSVAELAEDVSANVHNGDRIADISNAEGNVFGQIAFETYMRKGSVDVTVVAAPRHGPKIDFRVYPPEIKMNVHVIS